jgi:hypothetical protein
MSRVYITDLFRSIAVPILYKDLYGFSPPPLYKECLHFNS